METDSNSKIRNGILTFLIILISVLILIHLICQAGSMNKTNDPDINHIKVPGDKDYLYTDSLWNGTEFKN